MDKRRHPRVAIKNLSVELNDGVGFSQGTVMNISRYGLCITDLPKLIHATAKTMMLIVSMKDDYFRLFVKPKWYVAEGWNMTMGSEIINIPWRWKDFVRKHEPLQERDVSDLIQRIHQRQRRR